jgi:hypothetical protein
LSISAPARALRDQGPPGGHQKEAIEMLREENARLEEERDALLKASTRTG